MPASKQVFTARFARDAKIAELDIFSIAVERPAMENEPAADAALMSGCHNPCYVANIA